MKFFREMALWEIVGALVVIGVYMSAWYVLVMRRKLGTLKQMGFPSHEELASVGLTPPEFYDRYILPLVVMRVRGEYFNHLALTHFWRDYPQLDPRKTSREGWH